MSRQLPQLVLAAEIGPKECRVPLGQSPSRVLDLKQCQKVIIFGTFSGRVGDLEVIGICPSGTLQACTLSDLSPPSARVEGAVDS